MPEKVVVITGASEGIGASLARALGREKHVLVLAARRETELQKVAESSGTRALVVPGDVTRRADVDRIRDAAIREHGHVDVWVNNVGRGIHRSVLDLTDEDIDTMVTVNVKSALYGMQSIIPHFKDRGEGHLINVSTVLTRIPAASVRSAYSAAKAMLGGLTANLRMDLRSTHPNVHVTLVLPGLVATAFAKNVLNAPSSGGGPPAFTAGPFVPQTPEQVADAIVKAMAAPTAEVFTNPAHAEIAKRYAEDVEAFESQMARSHMTGPPPKMA